MTDMIHVFIADDNRLLREGLVSMLAEQGDIIVVGTAPGGQEAINQINSLAPDVALIDIGMPDKDGLEVTQTLHQTAPGVKVIILGMIDLTEEIMSCIEAGAVGYVLKEASFETLVDTIRSTYRGEYLCSPRMTVSLFTRISEFAFERMPKLDTSPINLTSRELEIINLIAEGLTNKDIAQRLFIETQTVKNHIHNILDKLHLYNRLQAVQYARDRNLLKKQP